ncbi:MAG TPA: hypothetical protein VHP11_07290 [Tepidisphaeraceae bacterium]|nr:hypothetical protein [Tepidisphaeraceae bacterium]
MSNGRPDIPETRMLPGTGDQASPERAIPTTAPVRQLQDLPKDELETLAEEFGLEPQRYPTRQHLVAAIHERRQLIAGLDREALLEVVKWGRRPVPLNATKEQVAQEIARIRSMRFSGLSQRGLVALGKLRGVPVRETDDVPTLVRKLKRQEGLFAKLNRKRRSLLGSLVSNMLGESESSSEYQFLPPQQANENASPNVAPPPRTASLKEEIEEAGLIGGIAERIRKSADSYVNQKLDEIEARIDRKLDEIDRRLAEWRDKEIANRIRILKITLWASVIVAVVSLLYSYIDIYLRQLFGR